MNLQDTIVGRSETLLVTGAAGFLGRRVVERLLSSGFRRIRCLVRPTGDQRALAEIAKAHAEPGNLDVVTGNLLSPADCQRITQGVKVILHLAAGTGSKAFADAYLNSVVTTRNLMDAAVAQGGLRRFVNVSSFTVYSNRRKPGGRLLDESAPLEPDPASRAEAYCYAKLKQDELVMEYGTGRGVPWVLIRPGVVFGPGKHSISGRIGIDSFGIFLHLGGANPIPFTYVENCAHAVVLAGLRTGIERNVFNIVDDNLPSSRRFLALYKARVRPFRSVYVPHALSYLLCWLWETFSARTQEQIPPAFTRREWHAYWKRTRYSNAKARRMLGWSPEVPMSEALERTFASCREAYEKP